MTIEEMVRRKRELGYSYGKISELSGVPLPTVQKVLGGITKAPRYETVSALEKVLAEKEPVRTFTYPTLERTMEAFREPRAAYGDYQYETTARENPQEKQQYADCFSYLPYKRQGEYTSKDRELLPDDIRTELIDGVIYDLASPKPLHQLISGEIAYELRSCIRKNGKNCFVFEAPSDVYLDRTDKTVVQPDIYVICNPQSMLEEDGYIHGCPEFIAEVLSPSTRYKDLFLKAYKYSKAGVREYWAVDPEKKQVIVYCFDDDPEHGEDFKKYDFDNEIPVGISEGRCVIDFKKISEQIGYFLHTSP